LIPSKLLTNSRWAAQSRQERGFVATDQDFAAASRVDGSVRELQVVGEIARAFHTASRPHEVYRLALDRLGPVIDASFACVFTMDGDDLLQVVAAYNWPQRYANHLGSMRIRIGNGPTGRAVLENRTVEIDDVFSDSAREDWWDPARELGFTSSISLPLAFRDRPVGAITFYFGNGNAFREADRRLLELVADQLAAAAEKAHLIEDLQRANAQLVEQNESLEARIREAEEAKRIRAELLANVSHELRTPLTAMLGYAFLLREGVTGEMTEPQQASVRKIEEAGNQLLALIDGMLDMTNIRLGLVCTAAELCDAKELALAALAAAPSPSEGVDIETCFPAERIPIHTDGPLVKRVLSCLLSNALKFTRDGSVVLRLRLEEPMTESEGAYRKSPDVVWEVIDTGIGIDTKDLEMIFEDFRQVDGSATRAFGGAGLGLAIAQGLARRLGGEVTVDSRSGEGSTFSLRLPSSVIRAGQR